MQSKLAEAVMPSIWIGQVSREDGVWTISGVVPASRSDGVVLRNADGSIERRERFRGPTFQSALAAAIAGGARLMGDPMERSESYSQPGTCSLSENRFLQGDSFHSST